MYITVNGCLAVMHPKDHTVALGSVSVGDTIGELALLDIDKQCRTDVVAVTRSKCYMLTRDDLFSSLGDKFPRSIDAMRQRAIEKYYGEGGGGGGGGVGGVGGGGGGGSGGGGGGGHTQSGREKEPVQELNSPCCVGSVGSVGSVGGGRGVGVGDDETQPQPQPPTTPTRTNVGTVSTPMEGGANGPGGTGIGTRTRTRAGPGPGPGSVGVKGEISRLVGGFSDSEARAALAMLQAMATVSRS